MKKSLESQNEINFCSKLHKPMKYDFTNTTDYRWLNKPVIVSKLIDNMEDETVWQRIGPGEMSFSQEKVFEQGRSLKLVSKTKIDNHVDPEDLNNYGRAFGEVVCRRNFAEEDWKEYNRLSFWVYPDFSDFRVISMYSILHNNGQVKIPDAYEREGLNFFLLQPKQWNHVVWEIASLPREKVTAVDIIYRLQGNEPEATDTVCFFIDKLELERVEADHYEGWNVAPGTISLSHSGYQAGASKTAIAAENIETKEFSVVNLDTGKTVLTKHIQAIKRHIGEFQLLDFSEIKEEGTYIIKAGSIETKPFQIGNNVWLDSIWKTINFFFCERCGFEVPGIHGNCHRDWQCIHDEKSIIINGGWHDAGDLSQGVCNTAEATYAMFLLTEKYKNEDAALYERLIEEAKWGLDWLLKTRFGDGYRSVWATMDFWTDGILGTLDDIKFKAINSPFDNFVTSAAEAKAAVVLKDIDAVLSSFSLRSAIGDWEFAIESLEAGILCASTRKQIAEIQVFAEGALASIEIFKATGEQKYANKAFEYAKIILQCQQKELTDWDISLSGFFYTSPEKKSLLHYDHRSHIQAPLVALSELCREFKDHPDWIEWYHGIFLFSEYMKKIMEFTQPYSMVPGSIYSIYESDDPNFREQVLNGIKLSEEFYLKLFPVWFTFRGNSSIILSGAKALSCSATTRKDLQLVELSQLNLQWMVGRNPFSQSLMYGEGYDFAPQYTAMSGNMVGSLPVGIQTSVNKDVPYWPANNCYNYKEVWVQPSARWLWLISDLSGAAKVYGRFPSGKVSEIQLLDKDTGSLRKTIIGIPKEEFHVELPEGKYIVQYKNCEKIISVLPGEEYYLNLERLYNIKAEKSETIGCKDVNIALTVKGNCKFTIEARTKNILLDKNFMELDVTDGEEQVIYLKGSIKNEKEYWLVVLIPDTNHADCIELSDC